MKKFKREYKLSKIEFIKFQLNQIINHQLTVLHDTDITILAYIYMYGLEATDKILEHRILTSPMSVSNYLSRLTKAGYIVKTPKTQAEHKGHKGYSDLSLSPNLLIIEEDFIQIDIVSLDKESDEVYHRHYQK